MAKFKGGLKEYVKHLSSLNDYLETATNSEYGHCEWKAIPLMISAIGKQAKIFDDAHIPHSSFYSGLFTNEEYFSRKGCGSVKEFFRERVK